MILSYLALTLVIIYAMLFFSGTSYKNKFTIALVIALLCFANMISNFLLLHYEYGSFVWLFNTVVWSIITYSDYKKTNE